MLVAYWRWWILTRTPDDTAGFAVTGMLACLISPVTWVHHLVWSMPALFLLLNRRRWVPLTIAWTIWSSTVVWLWWAQPTGWSSFAGSNAYVWVTLALMTVITKPWSRVDSRTPVLVEPGGLASALLHFVRSGKAAFPWRPG